MATVGSSYGASMTISHSSQTLRVVPSDERTSAPGDLHLVGAPTNWGTDVALTRVDSLNAHPLSHRIPPMSTAERAALLRDITERGVLTPLDVTTTRVILDGHERCAVAREVGLTHIPVRTIDPPDEADYILSCAMSRRHLSASQRAALVVECEQYRAACAEGQVRKLANPRQSPDVATLPHRGMRSREVAAKAAGVSARTIQDAATVREADPELFEDVLAGNIAADKAARQVRKRLLYAAIPPAPPMPEGPFEVILADPPWQMGAPGSSSCPENHYPTMTLAVIEALEIPAADDAVLFLWTVNSLLPEAIGVITAWGFAYRANLCWVKPSIGAGQWARQRHELVLVGVRGNMRTPREEDRPDSVIEARRGRHSQKPDQLYERIERAYAHLSKCELFARGIPRPGWTAWGNEVIPG
jgi:N6-adenosine-specific RNA methylase IME4